MNQSHFSRLSPQMAIRSAIEQAIQKLYNSHDISIRVVRQHRELRLGSLEFIDYAVPCFELARQAGQSPGDVALSLAHELKSDGDSPNKGLWQYEAVGGYINIQLSSEYLAQAIDAVGQWLSDPESTPTQGKDIYLLTGMDPDEPTESGRLFLEAYRHVSQAYKILGTAHEAICILSDFSERMPHYLSEQVSKKDPQLVNDMKARAQLYQSTRKFLADPSSFDDDNPVKQVFTKMHAAMLELYPKKLHQMDVGQYELLPESAIADQAHACIDGIESSAHKEGFIKDEASRAAYYVQNDKIIALRSAEGSLYGAAYLLSQLHSQLLQADVQPRTLVVFASNSLHRLITSYTDILRGRHAALVPVVFFDPHVSRVDIFQLQSTVPSLASHLQDISRLLENMPDDWLNQTKTRQSILSFVDLPEMLGGAVEVVQLPVLFDTISESAEVLRSFNG
jgi:hypothetical protein